MIITEPAPHGVGNVRVGNQRTGPSAITLAGLPAPSTRTDQCGRPLSASWRLPTTTPCFREPVEGGDDVDGDPCAISFLAASLHQHADIF